MSAKFEVCLWGREYFSLPQAYNIFNIFDEDACSIEIAVYSDCFMSNKLREFDSISDRRLIASVMDGFFVVSQGKLGNADIGVSLCREGDIFETSLWLDTKQYPELDSSSINNENNFIYRKIIHHLLSDNLPMDYCAIGSEMLVEYDQNTVNMVSSSHNVAVWILPDLSPDTYPPSFAKAITVGRKIILKKLNQTG